MSGVILVAECSHVVVMVPSALGENKRSVADDIVVVQTVMPLGGEEERFVAGHEHGIRGLQDKFGVGVFHRDLERVVVDDRDAERFGLHFTAVDGAGVFDGEEGGAGGGFGGGVERPAPRECEVVRGDGRVRLVRPHGILPQPEGVFGKIGTGAPILRHAGNDAAVLVVAGQPLKYVAYHKQRIVVRSHLRVEILRLVGERIADRLVGAVIPAARSEGGRQRCQYQQHGSQPDDQSCFCHCVVTPPGDPPGGFFYTYCSVP